jgi:pyruvate kinase
VRNVTGGEFVKAKIVCTIGPASMRPEALAVMKGAGMDVARLNLSHGDFAAHRRVAEDIREIGSVAILVDLPGPKIRIGRVDGNVSLVPGDRVHFTTRNVLGNSDELSVSHPGLPLEVSAGGSIYINDGLIEISVLSIDESLEGFMGRVISGGEVTSFKGVNAPGAQLSMRPPTEADLRGIAFGVEFCDWFAASFVKERGDVEGMKKAIEEVGGDQPLISKIEHREAVENIGEIVEVSDGVMVARGDLGIEMPSWEVPLIQKRIIGRCNEAGKPVIVATQMLESMVMNPRPTRAEASDVANAILDGADAVMLSGETAVGLFPVEAVKVMNMITQTVEEKAPRAQSERMVEGSVPDIIGQLASRAARAVGPAAIIVVTRSGFSARMVSKHRPRTPILSVARSPEVNRRARLYWGVEPLDVEWVDNRDELLVRAVRRSVEGDYLARGDSVMIVSGSTLEAPGRTSALEILSVADILEHARA